MNLLNKTDDEIIEIANPIWDNLVKTSNQKDYGGFTRDFSSQMLFGANEVELGKQWANNKILTSLSDKKDVLGGGLARGEIGVVVANTGVGKSHYLVAMGAEAVRRGKNVVHYTFELTETAVGIRYDSNLCEIPSNDIIDRKEEVLAVYEKAELGRLIIKEYPTKSASTSTIKSHIEKL